MSSILKALKKLESESERSRTEEADHRVVIDTRKALSHTVKRPWVLHRLEKMLIILILIAVGGWFVWMNKTAVMSLIQSQSGSNTAQKESVTPDTPKPQPVARTTQPQKAVSPPEASAPQTVQEPSVAVSSTPPDSVQATPRRTVPVKNPTKSSVVPSKAPLARPASLPGRDEPAVKSGSPFPPKATVPSPAPPKATAPRPVPPKATAPRPVPPKATAPRPAPPKATAPRPAPPKSKPVQAVRASRPPIKAATRPPEAAEPPVSSPVAAERLVGDELTLQALVWSDTAEDRIVVVNDRILRIGGSIDGYSITRIGMDHIIVRKGGKNWRVDFRIK